MSEPLEPLDPEIAHLFANEPIPAPTRGASARVLGRVAASIAVDAHVAGAGAGVAKQLGMRAFGLAVTTFLLGGVVGAGVATALHTEAPPRVVYVNVPVATTPPPLLRAPAPTTEPKMPAPRPPVTSVTPPAAPAPSAIDTLGAERLLIEDARAKLTGGAASEALVRLDDHARKFPKGHLAEEREALAIQALANADRAAEARARADAFRNRWPGSVYIPAVDATIHQLP